MHPKAVVLALPESRLAPKSRDPAARRVFSPPAGWCRPGRTSGARGSPPERGQDFTLQQYYMDGAPPSRQDSPGSHRIPSPSDPNATSGMPARRRPAPASAGPGTTRRDRFRAELDYHPPSRLNRPGEGRHGPRESLSANHKLSVRATRSLAYRHKTRPPLPTARLAGSGLSQKTR